MFKLTSCKISKPNDLRARNIKPAYEAKNPGPESYFLAAGENDNETRNKILDLFRKDGSFQSFIQQFFSKTNLSGNIITAQGKDTGFSKFEWFDALIRKEVPKDLTKKLLDVSNQENGYHPPFNKANWMKLRAAYAAFQLVKNDKAKSLAISEHNDPLALRSIHLALENNDNEITVLSGLSSSRRSKTLKKENLKLPNYSVIKDSKIISLDELTRSINKIIEEPKFKMNKKDFYEAFKQLKQAISYAGDPVMKLLQQHYKKPVTD